MPPQRKEEYIDCHKESRLHVVANRATDDSHAKESANQHVSESAHFKSTVALCLCTLTHSYLLISVFPYSGFMAMDLIENANEENAGSYAGLIASSFMVGRALTSYAWGRAADTYGRSTVLYFSLGFSCIFTLLFGVAPSFPWAMAFRFFLGLGNGMVGTAKTAVSELAGSNSKLETRGMGLVMGMWGWGFLLSPALSGALAEPVRQNPNNPFVQRFHRILSRYPFLLPNLVGAAFCVIAIIAVKAWVHETLPKDKRRSPNHIPSDLLSWFNRWFDFFRRTKSDGPREERLPIVYSNVVTYGDSQGKNDCDDNEVMEACLKHNESCALLSTATVPSSPSPRSSVKSEPEPTTAAEEVSMASLWARTNTRTHLTLYWVYSFVSICVDEAFPLFCISKEAGLGISEASIGKILSGSGLIFALCQYFLFSFIVNRCGLYPSIYIGSILAGPIITFIPLSLLLNNGVTDGKLAWPTLVFLSSIIALYRIFGSVFFSSISIATNRTVPSSHRATMNGLSMLGGSAAKGLGPAFAGVLVAFSLSSGVFPPRMGAVFVFTVIGFLGLMVAVGGYLCLHEDAQSIKTGEDKELEVA